MYATFIPSEFTQKFRFDLDKTLGWREILDNKQFFQVSSFQQLRLKHLHCADLHIILSLNAVQIYEFHILIIMQSTFPKKTTQKQRAPLKYMIQQTLL